MTPATKIPLGYCYRVFSRQERSQQCHRLVGTGGTEQVGYHRRKDCKGKESLSLGLYFSLGEGDSRDKCLCWAVHGEISFCFNYFSFFHSTSEPSLFFWYFHPHVDVKFHFICCHWVQPTKEFLFLRRGTMAHQGLHTAPVPAKALAPHLLPLGPPNSTLVPCFMKKGVGASLCFSH